MSAIEKPDAESTERPEEEQDATHIGGVRHGGGHEPLFLSGRSDGRKGDAQDEKDEAAE